MSVFHAKTPFIRERRRRKKNEKKTKKRTREAIGRAPDHDARKSWTSIRRLLSFPFESLLIFFFVRRESRLIQTHLVSRARESSLVLRCARNTNTNTNTTGHTRARAHLSSLESRLESRRKVAGKCEKNKRERAATVRVFERRKRRLEETRNRREKSTPERLGRGQRTRRTVAKTHIEQHKHTHAQRHARREREGQTTHREK